MSKEDIGYQCHVFVCTNKPDNPKKCGSKGAEDLRQDLKDKCGKAFGKKVRVNASGCLGYCEHGIAAVIYPEQEWLLDLDKRDADTLFEKINEKMKKK